MKVSLYFINELLDVSSIIKNLQLQVWLSIKYTYNKFMTV